MGMLGNIVQGLLGNAVPRYASFASNAISGSYPNAVTTCSLWRALRELACLVKAATSPLVLK